MLPVRISLSGIVATQLDAVDAILAQYSAPQGVIQIQHETFFTFQGQFLLDSVPPSLEIMGQLGIEECLRHQIVFPIDECSSIIAQTELREVYPLDMAALTRQLCHMTIKSGNGLV